ncbi:hypothetical protein H0A73_01335 [Alcaligenaceae bacterium]|nr:hypothetical protein [Alcaligenaceae bacterium]
MGGLKRLYPVFADLGGRSVRLVGGGAVAERKARMLLESHARLRVGAPALTATLQAWADEGRLTHDAGEFQDNWLDDVWLVIAATDDDAVNARVKQLADQRRILANVVDDPRHSSFQVPAVVDRSPILIAISSGGSAPVLARRLRERLESLFDHALSGLGQLAHRYRGPIREVYPDLGARRRFYDWLFDGPVLTHIRNGDPGQAERSLQGKLAEPDDAPSTTVTLIDATHVDPARLTLGGLRALYEADVIAYEDERAESLIGLARRDAARHRLSDADLRGPMALAHALVRLGETHPCIVLLKTQGAPDTVWLEQAASRLGNAGVVCRLMT